MEPDALPPELEVVAIREANRMLVERDAAHLARIAELEAALRSVRTILQSDSVEYDDVRAIDHIIDEAIAGDGDCQEHDWSWADAAGQQVCKRCGLRSPPSDATQNRGDEP